MRINEFNLVKEHDLFNSLAQESSSFLYNKGCEGIRDEFLVGRQARVC